MAIIVRASIDICDKKCQNFKMSRLSADDKQQAILEAASKSFAAYGFRKTSMDDIAKGAGMSRPAVYLHYRNKDDIFRSLVQMFYDSASSGVAQALGSSGAPHVVLRDAFRAYGGRMLEALLSSPHGLELLDAGAATASDIKAAGEAHLSRLYADWLERQARAGHIRLQGSAEDLAATICAALKGVKDASADYATYAARVDMLADLFGAGLSAR